MSKRHPYRFGMAYFGTRPLWARKAKTQTAGVVTPMELVIRDTHSEWRVVDLWNLYMAQANQALTEAQTAIDIATTALEPLNEQA